MLTGAYSLLIVAERADAVATIFDHTPPKNIHKVVDMRARPDAPRPLATPHAHTRTRAHAHMRTCAHAHMRTHKPPAGGRNGVGRRLPQGASYEKKGGSSKEMPYTRGRKILGADLSDQARRAL